MTENLDRSQPAREGAPSTPASAAPTVPARAAVPTRTPPASAGRYVLWGAVVAAVPAVAATIYVVTALNIDNLNGPGSNAGATLGGALFVAIIVALGGALTGLLSWCAARLAAARTEVLTRRALAAAIVPVVILFGLYLLWVRIPQRMTVLGIVLIIVIGVGAYFLSLWHETRARRLRTAAGPARTVAPR